MRVIYKPEGRAREYNSLAVNLYQGCEHGCKYCYAPIIRQVSPEIFHSNVFPRENILGNLRKDCEENSALNLFDQRPPESVLLCFITDPYQPVEERYCITRKAIKILHDGGYKVEILTKGGLRATRDFDLLGEGDAFACTLTFIDDVKSREWEPKAGLPSERIEALKIAHEKGIRTWVSLEPVIEPEQTFELIKASYKYTDQFRIGKLNYHSLEKFIDWKRFTQKAQKLLDELNCNYFFKEDLKKFMEIKSN